MWRGHEEEKLPASVKGNLVLMTKSGSRTDSRYRLSQEFSS